MLFVYLAVAKAEVIVRTINLGNKLIDDVTYCKIQTEDKTVASHYTKDNSPGAYLTQGGPLDVKVAEINMRNNCTKAVLAGNIATLICGDELYLLDSSTMIRNNYFKLDKIDGKQPYFRSHTVLNSNIILVSSVNDNPIGQLTYINAYDSTVVHFPSLIESCKIKTSPKVKYYEVFKSLNLLITFDTIPHFMDISKVKNGDSRFYITSLNTVGMPLPNLPTHEFSIFDLNSEDHQKVTILDIAVKDNAELVLFYLHEDKPSVQMATVCSSNPFNPLNFTTADFKFGSIEFPESAQDLLSIKNVQITQINKNWVMFYFPDKCQMIACMFIEINDAANKIVNKVQNCTNTVELYLKDQLTDIVPVLSSVEEFMGSIHLLIEIKRVRLGSIRKTIKSLEYQINPITPDKTAFKLYSASEWYVEANCHYVRFGPDNLLIALRERYLEYYLNTTNEFRVDFNQMVNEKHWCKPILSSGAIEWLTNL